MDGCADGHDFVGVHALVRLFADEFAGGLDDLGHACHAAYEHEFIDIVFSPLGVGEAVFHWLQRALEEVVGELLELGAGELFLNVLRPAGICRDEWQVDLVFLRGRKGDLGFFAFFFDALDGVGLLGEVDAGVVFELGDDPVHDAIVPVVTTEVGVAIGGADFKDAVTDFKGRDVECAAAKVIDSDFFVLHFVESVGERGCGGLVDDALHIEAGDLSGILRGVALRVVEISGNSDDSLRDFLAQLGFGVCLELREDHRGDFLWREALRLSVDIDLNVGVAIGGFHQLVGHAVLFAADFVEFAAHETLHREDCVRGVCDGLALGGLAYKALTGFCEGDDGWCGACALGVFQHDGLTGFHHRHARVCGS